MGSDVRAAHLRVDGVSKSFGARRVLTGITFTVSGGERAALIGENGTGKSTLLRLVSGALEPDAGSVTVVAPGGELATTLLHQDAAAPTDSTVGDVLELAVAEARAAAAAVTTAAEAMGAAPQDDTLLTGYEKALAHAEHLDAWTVDARIGAALDGLGLVSIDPSTPVRGISGGQRARLALAAHLLARPDVLLLDEPTNHLDDHATGYLVARLREWSGPVLLASHDRAFLDEVATTLIDLDPSPLPQAVAGRLVGDGDGSGIGVTRFSGRYTEYLTARLDAMARWERQFRDEQAELKRLRTAARDSHQVGHAGAAPRTEARASVKFYSDRNAKVVSRRVNDAERRLETLEQEQLRKPPKSLRFAGLTVGGGASGASSGVVLALSGVSVENRLHPVDLSISAGEKWLITGGNGTGKSTLLAVIAGHLEPTSGSVNHPRTLRIGLLTQDGELPPDSETLTLRTAYEQAVSAERAESLPLTTFGLFAGRDENRAVALMSTGQRRRLALAIVLADPPELLLLDEPTNHLSLFLAVELEAAIPEYPGTVIVASHDRWLRRHWAGQRLTLSEHQTDRRRGDDPDQQGHGQSRDR